ncbi:hypothetical protein EAO27_18385 [Sphingopyxis sp. YF1]|uniref:hypothetical protein n=1 Tax=Sphingopyxis sp. YF1 TaxID=2482763 RepID=UPI001F622448|nr:hypothetical protein [Sphingopyxis sp. YF1]UNU44457.1 hypothetical protein EAO27_18385 [Sphingopyxis sp. YF1]
MRSIVSSYPGGAAALGLALLRCSVAIPLLADMLRTAAPLWQPVGIGLLIAGLLCGFRARLLAAICCLAALTDAASGDGAATAIQLLDAFALALLGPGAWSIDALLFGRKTIVVPGRSTGNDPGIPSDL